MVFGSDMILNTPFIVDWETIRIHEKNIIDMNKQIDKKA